MKTLILTEKPSVARDFAKALNIPLQGDGFFEDENTIITWAIGHLMELKAPGDYQSQWKSWTMSSLPILPDRLQYKEIPKVKKQLAVVKKQLKRKDIGRFVLATDAGREGELIGRTLLNESKVSFDCYRFWTSQALSAGVIKDNLKKLKPLQDYDRLYLAGRSRQSADWLVGMNLSRLATINMGDLFSVGRVQTAVLALLVKRRKEINAFKPEPYFLLHGNFRFSNGEFKAIWFDPKKKSDSQKISNEDIAKSIIAKCTGHPAVVKEVKKEKKQLPPPQLFSLTELQKVANRKYNFSAKKTLSLAQSLYEKHKCLSYPRTDAQVLGTKSFSQVCQLTEQFKSAYREHFEFFDSNRLSDSNKRVFNDAQLTDHHALIPLSLPGSRISGEEHKIFDLVMRRFIAVFCKDFVYEESIIHCGIQDENFKSKGQRVVCLGWKSLLGGSKEQFLPDVQESEQGEVKTLKSEKKMTLPPPEYSEASLLQDMINPGRLVEEKQCKEIFRGEIGLGTQATRAQIIETLLHRKYVTRSSNRLVALPKGLALIENLEGLKKSKVLTSPEETAKWECELERIAQGQGDARAFMIGIRQFVQDCVQEWKQADIKTHEPTKRQSEKPPLGQCPLCKAAVIESPKSYCCEKWRLGCKFKIWKKIAGRGISVTQTKKILSQGRSDRLKGFKSKEGKKFSAALEIKGDGLGFVFSSTKKENTDTKSTNSEAHSGIKSSQT